jgi:ubiquinone/menaquinone biosynthesis C-methylase UbiE
MRQVHAARRRIGDGLLAMLELVFTSDAEAYKEGLEFTEYEVQKAPASVGRYLTEIGNNDIDVLDFGCGWGGETLWLAERVRSAIGVDVDAEAIVVARQALDRRPIANCRFLHAADNLIPLPDRSVDVVFSTDTFEHVMDLDTAFAELLRVLRPGGALVTRFGPLFYSPYGYHLYWACQVPWAHLVFGLRRIVARRNRRTGSTASPERWQELGLNGRRFAEFRQSALRAGFELARFDPIPVRGLSPLTWIPRLRDLFIFGVDAYLRRPGTPRVAGETARCAAGCRSAAANAIGPSIVRNIP